MNDARQRSSPPSCNLVSARDHTTHDHVRKQHASSREAVRELYRCSHRTTTLPCTLNLIVILNLTVNLILQVLKKIAWFVVLAPAGPDQITLLNGTAADRKLAELPLYKELLSNFLTKEVLR